MSLVVTTKTLCLKDVTKQTAEKAMSEKKGDTMAHETSQQASSSGSKDIGMTTWSDKPGPTGPHHWSPWKSDMSIHDMKERVQKSIVAHQE